MNFKPDDRNTTYRNLSPEKKIPPKIIFSTLALKWIEALIDAHDSEVGFYAVVDERNENTYFIRDIFYPKHDEANWGTCEISPEGETDIMNYLIEKNRENDIPKIRFWGHVHSGFTTPSGQDEQQALERMRQTQAFLIRAICTSEEISISFFDFNNQIRFDNVKWEIEEQDSKDVMSEKLEEIKTLLDQGFADDNIKEVFEGIVETLLHDKDMELIKEKVKKLKEANMPKHAYHRGVNSYQQNLFDHSNDNYINRFLRKSTPTLNKKEEKEEIDDNEILNETETMSLMSDIDDEIQGFDGCSQFFPD